MTRGKISDQEKSKIENLQSEMLADLLKEDELGVIIRAHIRIERQLIDILDVVFVSREVQKIIKPTYSKRVKLCIVLGLDESLQPSLDFIGALRNRFAHSGIEEITDKDANDFEQKLSSDRREAMKNAYQSAMRESGINPVPTEQLSPRQRVVLCLVALWSAVAVGAAQARADHVLPGTDDC